MHLKKLIFRGTFERLFTKFTRDVLDGVLNPMREKGETTDGKPNQNKKIFSDAFFFIGNDGFDRWDNYVQNKQPCIDYLILKVSSIC